MSEKWSQNLEKYLLSIQKDINKKIDQLEEKIDHIYLEQQSFLEEVGQGSQSQKRSNEKPTQKLPEIDLKKEKKEQQKVSVTTLNDASSITAEFISKKFEESTNRILHTFREFSKGHEHSKAFEKLSDEEKKYITESNLQTIGERLDIPTQNETGNNEALQLKNTINILQSSQNDTFIQLEEYKKQLSYKQQEISVLKKVIAEKDAEFEQLLQETQKMEQELENNKNQLTELEQFKAKQNLQIEKDELYAKISVDMETKYKKELTDLKDVLNKRKIEIKNLKKENEELHEVIKLKGHSS